MLCMCVCVSCRHYYAVSHDGWVTVVTWAQASCEGENILCIKWNCANAESEYAPHTLSLWRARNKQVSEHASKQMCDRITCMKEYNAAALFNLYFSWRQMFEFVRTHGKICNNKTISAFVSTMYHHHYYRYAMLVFFSLSHFSNAPFCSQTANERERKSAFRFLPFQHFTAHRRRHGRCFAILYLCKTKLHEHIALLMRYRETNAENSIRQTYKHPFNICKQRVRQFIANKQTTCWIFIYFHSMPC